MVYVISMYPSKLTSRTSCDFSGLSKGAGGAGIVSFITHDPQWQIHVSTSANTSACNIPPPSHILLSYHLLPKERAAETRHPFFHYHPILCHVSSHLTASPSTERPQLLFSGHRWLIEDREDADAAGQIRSLKLCDVLVLLNCGGKDSRWAWLGWGPFKSNRVASVPGPARATLSEQITCSSKGYDSPWHLCWEPAIPDSCGL